MALEVVEVFRQSIAGITSDARDRLAELYAEDAVVEHPSA